MRTPEENLQIIATQARIEALAPGIALVVLIALAWWILHV